MSGRYSKPIHDHDLPWWFYDLLIVVGCLFFAWLSIVWSPLALLPLAVLLYGSFIEPRLLLVKRYSIGKGERTITIAFISDIHVGPYKGSTWVRELARRTNELSPDLVLLGGDFLHKSAADLPKLEPLKTFKAPLGVFAILGNHDEFKAEAETREWFANSGLSMLINSSTVLDHAGGKIALAGADDDWYAQADLEAAFRGISPDTPLIAMLHNPDLVPPSVALLKERSASTLFISGHTHAGQIRLPLIGSVMPLPHHLGRSYDRGVFKFGETTLVIGSGTGESGPRARLLCPPEIVLVTMHY